MTERNESVHPWGEIDGRGGVLIQHKGLTKREYMATQALNGLMAREGWAERLMKEQANGGTTLAAQLGEAAVKAADALIFALNTTK